VLLWDLDPQAASSFAFRVRPRVPDFGRRSLDGGEAFEAAIKQTDYDNLDLLPADFAYRKLDRLLGRFSNPARVVADLLGAIGHGYDTVFLDCAAGFSLLTEGILAAADLVLVPTIPTVLSLRMVARIVKWADRAESTSELAAFFNMVDRRKALHRRVCDWPEGRPGVFLNGQIPYASVVEQMTVRRQPLARFAPRDPATSAFSSIWPELHTRLQQRRQPAAQPRERWRAHLRAIESLIMRTESTGAPEAGAVLMAPGIDPDDGRRDTDLHFIHGFDTDGRDLQRAGYVLELHERSGSLTIVAARSARERTELGSQALAEIDRCWAIEILSGATSPLTALERRLGALKPRLVEQLRAAAGGRKLRRIGSGVADPAAEGRERRCADAMRAQASTVSSPHWLENAQSLAR
jgi:cellulose biosynthesis protein BcsQ